MKLSALKQQINNSPRLKQRLHRLMFQHGRPRSWVKWLLNPWVFQYGKRVVIRRRSVLNLSPNNPFSIGDNSRIEEFCVLDNGVGEISIGNETLIGLRCTLIGPLRIGSQVILAQNVVLSGLNHCYQDTTQPIIKQGITTATIIIDDDVWIGANAVITAGVHIGKHCVVAAGSIVTKDVPPYSVVAGNPARVIKYIEPNK
ncbi:MAG: acyltransferase [Prevotellaceae bacterium]|jgi:acetyltransferase-like isoleucine patch superfamily enzyme|nr:acyltransferase [Prevotellaceae bacterium]